MSTAARDLLALLLAAVLIWQLVSGRALGTWWLPTLTREASPRAYWFSLALQGAILVALVLTGGTWTIR